jgi:hypothetical protein
VSGLVETLEGSSPCYCDVRFPIHGFLGVGNVGDAAHLVEVMWE